MSKHPVQKFCNLFTLAVCFFISSFSLHAAEVSLMDVQTAFLEKDYAQTKKLAEDFTARSQPREELWEVMYLSGLSDLWLGQYLPARQTLQSVLNEDPSRDVYDRVSLALVDTYYMEGDYKKALRLAEDLLSHSSRSEFLSSIYLRMARAHLKLAHWKKGRQLLEKIIERFPQSPERYSVDQLLQESQFFAVQVGSFQNQSKAEKVVDDLKQKGEYAYLVETSSQDGKKFYRVRVGKFQKFEQARMLEGHLSQLGYPTRIYP